MPVKRKVFQEAKKIQLLIKNSMIKWKTTGAKSKNYYYSIKGGASNIDAFKEAVNVASSD